MPTYDYQCDGSDRVFEVNHAMSVTVKTWGELSKVVGLSTDEFPGDTPVRKILASSGGLVSSSSLKNPEAPPCVSGGGCPGSGGCGI